MVEADTPWLRPYLRHYDLAVMDDGMWSSMNENIRRRRCCIHKITLKGGLTDEQMLYGDGVGRPIDLGV